jgi:hypothetical protein
MVSKCANPACTSVFHFLHEGRIFTVVRAENKSAGADAGTKRRVEHYWLCNACARTMTLTCSAGKVAVRPLPGDPPAPRLVLSENYPPPGVRAK